MPAPKFRPAYELRLGDEILVLGKPEAITWIDEKDVGTWGKMVVLRTAEHSRTVDPGSKVAVPA